MFFSRIQKVMIPLFIFAAGGCTKQLDYETLPKDRIEAKGLIDESAVYVYAPSSTNSSRNSTSARPYWMGDHKLVKFRFTESALEILEVERDPRFKDNSTNEHVVMTIPVAHIEYQCAKDSYGECTNKEEEAKKTPWNARTQFQPKFEDIKISETNVLPLEVDALFGSKCYTETASRFAGYQLEKDALNFQIEKTFRVDIRCASGLDDLSDLTVSAIYHYSFAKLDAVATAGYEPIPYPLTDESEFGFFTTKTKKLDVDYSDVVASEATWLNRWDPNKDKLTYFLSKEFTKPENSALRQATIKGVEKLNRGMEQAGLKMRIELKDADGRVPGDLRYNFIIMVEDPIASGILGYGPTVTNPLTGEIISGRTVMYPGVMKQYVRWTYDQIFKEESQAQEGKTAPTLSPELQASAKTAAAKISQIRPEASSVSKKSSVPVASLERIKETLLGHALARKEFSNIKDRLGLMSKYCAYPAELFNFDEAVAVALKNQMPKGKLKPWEKMSNSEKQAAIDVILPEVWIPTLVHEMGHNLGLRHNFKGSEDKDNFYTTQELAQMGVTQSVPYSSVMDYPYSDLNFLPTLGKYDVAALRFAYGRQVQDKQGKWIAVATSLADLQVQLKKEGAELKSFGYCTDEHVDVNVGCKRFDEGTSLTEMVQHAIKSYQDSYVRRNFRRDRRNFSLMSDASVADRLEQEFQYIRFNFEAMGRFKQEFGLEYDDPIYDSDEPRFAFLKDMKKAATLAGEFLLDVVLTPDMTCLIADTNENQLVGVIPVVKMPTLSINKDFGAKHLQCSDFKLQEPYRVVGETGLHFNSKKDPDAANPYMDQIDVRGIWINKLVATETLLNRQLGSASWDKTDDNFMDLVSLRPALLKGLTDLTTGTVSRKVQVRLYEGGIVEVPLTLDMGETQVIDRPLSADVRERFQMPDRDVHLQELIMPLIKKSSEFRLAKTSEDRAVADGFAVTRVSASSTVETKGPDGKKLDLQILSDGDYKFIATARNQVARNLMSLIDVRSQLDDLDRQQVLAAFKKLSAGQLKDLKGATKVEKVVARLGVEKVQEFLQEEIQSQDFLGVMLGTLVR